MHLSLPSFEQTAPCPAANVIPFRAGFLPRHREYLSRWLEAGLSMGLFDADIEMDRHAKASESVSYVLVWVRENADPAYMVRPQGNRWLLIDQLRGHSLGVYTSFEHALHTIRPVLPLSETVAA